MSRKTSSKSGRGRNDRGGGGGGGVSSSYSGRFLPLWISPTSVLILTAFLAFAVNCRHIPTFNPSSSTGDGLPTIGVHHIQPRAAEQVPGGDTKTMDQSSSQKQQDTVQGQVKETIGSSDTVPQKVEETVGSSSDSHVRREREAKEDRKSDRRQHEEDEHQQNDEHDDKRDDKHGDEHGDQQHDDQQRDDKHDDQQHEDKHDDKHDEHDDKRDGQDDKHDDEHDDKQNDEHDKHDEGGSGHDEDKQNDDEEKHDKEGDEHHHEDEHDHEHHEDEQGSDDKQDDDEHNHHEDDGGDRQGRSRGEDDDKDKDKDEGEDGESKKDDEVKEEGGGGDRHMDDSDSFRRLRTNVHQILANLSDETVNRDQREHLQKTFENMFDEFAQRKFDEVQPKDDKSKRLPYGKLHKLAHQAIDNTDLDAEDMHDVHRAIHFAFSKSFDPNICYERYSKDHTGCLKGSGRKGCEKVASGVDGKDKRRIIDTHNAYRSEVARGVSEVEGHRMPSASVMFRMTWDDELAYLAQAWADQCDFNNDCAECRRTDRLRFVGQNIVRIRGIKDEPENANWKAAVRAWGESRNSLPSLSSNEEDKEKHEGKNREGHREADDDRQDDKDKDEDQKDQDGDKDEGSEDRGDKDKDDKDRDDKDRDEDKDDKDKDDKDEKSKDDDKDRDDDKEGEDKEDFDDEILKNYRHDDAWAAYTQVIWDYTYLVGCGFSAFKEKDDDTYSQLYVCNYGAAGNVLGGSVYRQGEGCSDCPKSHRCEQDTKLCTFGEEDEPPRGFIEDEGDITGRESRPAGTSSSHDGDDEGGDDKKDDDHQDDDKKDDEHRDDDEKDHHDEDQERRDDEDGGGGEDRHDDKDEGEGEKDYHGNQDVESRSAWADRENPAEDDWNSKASDY